MMALPGLKLRYIVATFPFILTLLLSSVVGMLLLIEPFAFWYCTSSVSISLYPPKSTTPVVSSYVVVVPSSTLTSKENWITLELEAAVHVVEASPIWTENFIEFAGTVLVLSEGFGPAFAKNQKAAFRATSIAFWPLPTLIVVEISVLTGSV